MGEPAAFSGLNPDWHAIKILESKMQLKPNTKQQHIGRKIRDTRKDLGWNQTELARRAYLTTSCIWNIERLNNGPSLTTVRKIAKAMGVTVAQLNGDHQLDTAQEDQAFLLKWRIINKLSKTKQKIIKELIEEIADGKT